MTEGSIAKNIWYLALPMMVGNVLQDLFNIVDMIFVGKLGPAAIAAVSMSGILLMLVMTVAIGISTGTVALVARHFGAKQQEQAENVAIQAVFVGILSSVVLGVLGYVLAAPVLRLLGAGKDVVPLGTSYIQITSVGAITIFLGISLNSALRGAGDAVTPMKILVLSTVLNIGLDPLLIFGIWKFPRLGVAGSALATVISRGVGLLLLLRVFLNGHSLLHLKWRRIRVDIKVIKRMIKIGVFGSLQMLIRNISALILIRIVAIYGTSAVAAYGIGMRLRMMVMMPGMGLANASATLVGQNLGAKQPKRAGKSAWLTTGFYEVFMVSVGVLFIIFAKDLIRIFNTDPQVIQLGTTYLRFLAPTFVFMALSIVLGRAMNGAGDTFSPMNITAVSFLGFRLPLAYVFAQVLKLATTGIWAGIAVSNVVQGSAMAWWFKKGKWKSNQF
ncbi:MATE family efflux transporter [candidate division KSB1 bacterium]|nr:MAG: MATE family efflux transporter [candidate division KSB1 bacterium]